MKNTQKYIAAAAAFGVAATLVATVPTAANAEAVADGYVVVGSDTLQDVLKGLANGTSVTGANVRVSGQGTPLTSFDAIGTVNLQAKPYGNTFGRPNGSGDGRKALSRSIDGAPFDSATPGDIGPVVITGQVDIARSSSAGTSNANGTLLQIPFGRDGLSYAHNSTNPAFDHITAADLKGIFEGTITTIGGEPVRPEIPQAGSGTRSDFISKIGSTEAAIAAQVTAGVVKTGQEHDTTALQGGAPMPANSITPMSAAQWVAQNTGAGTDRRGAGFKIGSPIAGVSPVTGSGASMVPNSAFYTNGTWGRDTYIVVEAARVTVGESNYDAKLASLVGSAQLANRGTLPASAGAVKVKYGFLPATATTPNPITAS